MGNIYVGDSGVTLVAPMNNTAIVLDGTWTIKFYLSLANGEGQPPSPLNGTYSEDGSEALYTLVGTEFGTTAGTYNVEVVVSKGSTNKKCVVQIVVQKANP